MTPTVFGQFFRRYDKNKFPRDDIAKNVLETMGVPSDQTDECLEIVKANARYAGLIQQIAGAEWVSLASVQSKGDGQASLDAGQQPEVSRMVPEVAERHVETELSPPAPPKSEAREVQRVFISHGKNKQILEQLKMTIELGGFEPEVAVEQETPAIPVSYKVFEAMRQCQAGVINVSAEEREKGEDGNYRVNENVLIEIGAAFVLYEGRLILVWDKRVNVPSNLEGLYRCEYEGSELTLTAAMKLQKALLSLKKGGKPSIGPQGFRWIV